MWQGVLAQIAEALLGGRIEEAVGAMGGLWSAVWSLCPRLKPPANMSKTFVARQDMNAFRQMPKAFGLYFVMVCHTLAAGYFFRTCQCFRMFMHFLFSHVLIYRLYSIYEYLILYFLPLRYQDWSAKPSSGRCPGFGKSRRVCALDAMWPDVACGLQDLIGSVVREWTVEKDQLKAWLKIVVKWMWNNSKNGPMA